MKTSWEFVNVKGAVSAVIGVVLMVAITVAIAATVYVYMSGMLATGSSETPEIAFYQDEKAHTLTVSKVSRSNVPWSEIIAVASGGYEVLEVPGGTFVEAGNQITNCYGSVTISYKGSTLLGTWIFTDA